MIKSKIMQALIRRLAPYALFFIVTQQLIRITLLVRSLFELDMNAVEILQILLRGLWFDLVTAGFVMLPIMLVVTLTRAGFWQRRAAFRVEAGIRFVYVFLLLFGGVSEHFFWTEFSTRFNFIAVDYLIYTQEVIGNIRESYPVGWITLLIALISGAIVRYSLRTPCMSVLASPVNKWRMLALYLLVCVGGYNLSNIGQAQFNENAEAGEIAASGIYNLFYAFWHNEISYERFYAQQDSKAVIQRARSLLAEPELVYENETDLTRIIKAAGPELHKNVIIVVMESMSASYMGSFGNTDNLTPNLDRFAKEGLLFSNLYATGTRTVRGLEAVALSIPPTPGQSIVRRPNNGGLFSLGYVFKDRGYDTKFIYGGYGYFDNMNNFFAANGFDVVDRTNLSKEEINFANVWGVADDDLFARAIKEADVAYANNAPFMQMVMTTTNHRPYTYPEGRIDIASKTGRMGGVKYADYSIGKLVEWARTKPWFKDTVFVFVADHTAGAGGKAELDPQKYHIPMIFYSPSFIKPKRFEPVSSQIDLAPTLLGMLRFSYRTKFYGEDLLNDNDEVPHAFISNYQKIALVKEDEITILAPKREVKQLSWPTEQTPENSQSLIDDTVAYYQSASWWREKYKRVPTVLEK
jgi:phosphoglycerol transferase MdoB-like AlkP superfamily enzyme